MTDPATALGAVLAGPGGLLLAGAAGTALGCLTGLVPGIHPNTLAALLVAAPLLPGAAGAVLLVSAAVAHTFLNVVPALMLGVSDPDVALSVLPGHALVRRGEGEDAILHSAAGSLAGLLLALAAVPVLPLLARAAWPLDHGPVLAAALVGLAAYLVLGERGGVPLRRTVVPVFDGVAPPGEVPVGLGRVSRPAVRVEGRVAAVAGDGFALEPAPGGWVRRPAVGGDGPPGATGVGRGRPAGPRSAPTLLARAGRGLADAAASVADRLVPPPASVPVEDLHGWADRPAEGDAVVVYGELRRRPGPGSRAAAMGVALAVFVGAGLLGMAAADLPYAGVLGPGEGLLPLLTGLFGGGTLLLARDLGPVLRQAPGAPPRDLAAVRWALPGVLAGGLVAVLPSVTAAQGAALSTLGRVRDHRAMLATLGAVNTAAAVLSLGVLVAFGRVRTGVAHALAEMPTVPAPGLLFAAALVAGAAAFAATVAFGRRALRHAHRLAARRTALAVLTATALLVAALTGPLGLLVFAVCSAFGTIPPRLGVRRVHLMGALVVPLLWGLLAA